MKPIELLDLPHVQARELVATGVPVYLTVNPVEYHGPHLSLHNDLLVSRGLCARLHARLQATRPNWPFVIASDLEIGAEPTKGAGSRAISYEHQRTLVLEAVTSLAELGVKRVVLMTFHGGPMHNLAIDAGVRYLEARGIPAIAPLAEVMRLLIDDLDPSEFASALAPIADPKDRARVAARLGEDIHAGFFETSMALALAPHSVDPGYVHLAECPEIVPDPVLAAVARVLKLAGQRTLSNEIMLGARAGGWGALDPFPGYTGAPHLASAASGEAFIAHAMERFVPLVRDVLLHGKKAPPPVMSWMEKLSLGGKLAPASTFARMA